MGLNMWQLLLVLLIVILLFGRGRIPALMGDVAAGIKSFKQGLGDDNETPATQQCSEQKRVATADVDSTQPAVVEQKNA